MEERERGGKNDMSKGNGKKIGKEKLAQVETRSDKKRRRRIKREENR